jgi:hypothetical protein
LELKNDHVLEGPGAFGGVQSSMIEIRVTVKKIYVTYLCAAQVGINPLTLATGVELVVRFGVQLVAKLERIRVSDEECHHLQPEFPWLCGTEFGSVAGSAGVAKRQKEMA